MMRKLSLTAPPDRIAVRMRTDVSTVAEGTHQGHYAARVLSAGILRVEAVGAGLDHGSGTV